MKNLSEKLRQGESNRFLWTAAKFLVFFVFKLFFRLEIQGSKNIPASGGFIIASNHASYLDPPLIGYACPRPIAYIAKQERVPGLLGVLTRRLGAIPVITGGLRPTDLKAAINIVKRGRGLLIFPEGTRSRTGKFLPPKPGIGFVVINTGAPVVPVFIKGSYRALQPGRKFVKMSKLIIKIGEPCYYSTRQTYEEIAQDVMKRIIELSK